MSDREYAFLMIDYETPEFIKDLQSKIKEEELYKQEGIDGYGIETESHVTLVPCLDNDIDVEDLKKYLKPLDMYNIILTDLSKFECDDFDVLKCAVKSEALHKTNKEIREKYETHSEYKEYSPHLTVAYMKKGMADKYTKKILDKLIHLKAKNFSYSFIKNKDEHQIKFEK